MATYRNSFWHCVALGQIYGGADIWAAGFHVGNNGDGMSAPAQQAAQNIGDAWAAMFQNPAMKINQYATTLGLRISHIGADGKTILADTVQNMYPGPVPGGAPGQGIPQVALAVSFKASSIPKGPGANGRMYLPMPMPGLTTTGQILQNDINGMLPVLKTFFNAVNAEAQGDGGVLINVGAQSVKHAEAAENGIVTSIRIGNTLDTQRRRRNRLHESYTGTSIP